MEHGISKFPFLPNFRIGSKKMERRIQSAFETPRHFFAGLFQVPFESSLEIGSKGL